MKKRPAQIGNMMTSGVLRLLLPIVLGPLGVIPTPVFGQQVPDTTFRPQVVAPAYELGNGPLVMVDEAHNNSHTLKGSYRGFAELLRQDGYRLEPFPERFSQSALSRGDILVIINALASENVDNWSLPTPSALTVEEISEVREWVRTGGALLLVADHMPFPGATKDLAREFGVVFTNGFAVDTAQWDPLVFRRADGSLTQHPITKGRKEAETVDSVATFWGQAFRAVDGRVSNLLLFGRGVVSLNPEEAWRFTERTPTVSVEGWIQGGALTLGAGRVVILGEAGMLTAQFVGPDRIPTGMNAPIAGGNSQFALNVMHWLSGLLPSQ